MLDPFISSVSPPPQTALLSGQNSLPSQYHERGIVNSMASFDFTLQDKFRESAQIQPNTSTNSSNSLEERDSFESIMDLYSLVMTEVSTQGITNTIFAKVVLNEPCHTLEKIFQSRGEGYDYFVQVIKNFLSNVPYEERAKRYKNVSRVMTEGREDTGERLSREVILDVIQQTKAEMSRMGLTQQVFAKVVLGRTPGIVSQMFKFNGVGYEKHIHTIRNFLTRPAEERHMLYKKGLAPVPWDNQPVRPSSSSTLQRVSVPEGLASEFFVTDNTAAVNQVTNSTFSSFKLE